MSILLNYINEILQSLDIPQIKTSKNKTEDSVS